MVAIDNSYWGVTEPPVDDYAPDLDLVDEVNTWEPLDLGPWLRGEVRESVPELGLVRSDGQPLLYPGKEHSIIGEMESGKSWFTCACTFAEISKRQHVIYVHFEEGDPSDTIGRLLALGSTPEDIATYLHFVGPMRAVRHEDLARLITYRPSLVILDGVNEAMSLHSLAIREEDGSATFRRRMIKPFTAAGAAVLTCDHVIKDKEGRGRYALGSIHKGNAVDGAIFLLENAEPFGRGLKGRSHVFVTKDRPGHLRKHGKPTRLPGKTLIAELVVDDATYEEWLELHLFAVKEQPNEPPKVADERVVDELLCRRILDVIAANNGTLPSQRAVGAALREAGFGTRPVRYNTALDDLVHAGRLEEIPNGQKKVYRLVPTASQDQIDFPDSETS